MQRAVAIAITQEKPQDYPIKAAVDSAANFAKFLADFMYGTPMRARFTYAFAFALGMLGYAIGRIDPAILQNCPI